MRRIHALVLSVMLILSATMSAAGATRRNTGQCVAASVGMVGALAALFFPPTTGPAVAFYIASLWVGVPAAASGMTACRR